MFQQGMMLKAVWGPMTESGQEGASLNEGPYHCRLITVSMEDGQMSGVPWAKCTRPDGSVYMLNLAMMESVELL